MIGQGKFTHRQLYDWCQTRFLAVLAKFGGRLLVADKRLRLPEGWFEHDKVVVLPDPFGIATVALAAFGAVRSPSTAEQPIEALRGRTDSFQLDRA